MPITTERKLDQPTLQHTSVGHPAGSRPISARMLFCLPVCRFQALKTTLRRSAKTHTKVQFEEISSVLVSASALPMFEPQDMRNIQLTQMFLLIMSLTNFPAEICSRGAGCYLEIHFSTTAQPPTKCLLTPLTHLPHNLTAQTIKP